MYYEVVFTYEEDGKTLKAASSGATPEAVEQSILEEFSNVVVLSRGYKTLEYRMEAVEVAK